MYYIIGTDNTFYTVRERILTSLAMSLCSFPFCSSCCEFHKMGVINNYICIALFTRHGHKEVLQKSNETAHHILL